LSAAPAPLAATRAPPPRPAMNSRRRIHPSRKTASVGATATRTRTWGPADQREIANRKPARFCLPGGLHFFQRSRAGVNNAGCQKAVEASARRRCQKPRRFPKRRTSLIHRFNIRNFPTLNTSDERFVLWLVPNNRQTAHAVASKQQTAGKGSQILLNGDNSCR